MLYYSHPAGVTGEGLACDYAWSLLSDDGYISIDYNILQTPRGAYVSV